ncbi:MAG: M20/M25/M40 family metallo-hydrolase [Acidobacteriota bacterium]
MAIISMPARRTSPAGRRCPEHGHTARRARDIAAGVLTLCLLMLPAQAAPGNSSDDAAHRAALTRWVREHRAGIRTELTDFLSIPNVSHDLSAIEANARRLETMFAARGMTLQCFEGEGGPYLFARLPPEAPATGKRAPVVLFYAHYDGQPVDRARWTRGEPFSPTLVGRPGDADARLYGRSASDDKAPIVALLAAIDGLRAAGIPPNIDAKFILDPEEESGSPHLEATLAAHRDLLAADLLIFADGPVHQSGRPTLVFGTRGIITVSLTLYGPAVPLHSGHYGNWAPNPAEKLASLLASMKDDSGHVLVDGFYDDVVPLTGTERAALARVPPEEPDLMKRLLIFRPDGNGRRLQELLNEPSLNVRGLAAAWVGEAARTIVPDTATAEIDLRLVRDIDPMEQVDRLRAHLRRQGYTVVGAEPDAAFRRAHARVVRLTHGAGTRASRTPMDTPLSRAVIAAVSRAAMVEPVLLPTLGGTGPLSRFEALLDLPTYGVPIVNPDNNQHSPDENLRLGNLWDGIVIYASLLRLTPPAR